MPAIGYQYNFIQGLSTFWNRFFNDSPQLEALYKGSAIAVGQAYLDLMSVTLGIALKDTIVFDKEYYKMFAIREDEVYFLEGVTTDDNRWVYPLPDNIVNFASLDNKVVEPTASLEPKLDYTIVDRVVHFKVDPTDPDGLGLPLPGYARRALDIETGGKFTDATVISWLLNNVKKGDTLRLLDIGTTGLQRKRSDHIITLVRADALYVDLTVPLPSPAPNTKYSVLRVPPDYIVLAEAFTLVANAASFTHTRLDQGSVRVYAKAPGGEDVVENVDYTINYEAGTIIALTTWLDNDAAVDYTWKEEISPTGGPSPQAALTGVIVSAAASVRVIQIAVWAPDALVDRMTLSNNFGSLIGRTSNSSEAYRAFLEGIFQLYILGPCLERIESALNVVLNFPVVRDDGEIFEFIDVSDSFVDRVITSRTTYDFPKGAPLRTDLVAGATLEAFEVLTTAVTVTDYVQSPQWWYGETIPVQLFVPVNGFVPPAYRRNASPVYIEHVYDPSDSACYGDPGLYYGAADDGDASVFVDPHPIFRHRMAFVLMDRYLKYHTFSVKFDALALSATVGSAFQQSLIDLNELILTAKPSHTFAFTTPSTAFRDEIEVLDNAISFDRLVGSRTSGPDKVIFTDGPPTYGAGIWSYGDYFTYELWTSSTVFASIGVPVTLAHAPVGPRHGYLVRAFLDGDVAGVALVENVDYSIDYPNRAITRLTVWTSNTVDVTFRQLNIGNTSDAPASAGDMPVMINGNDPALITADFDPSVTDWAGTSNPPTAPRDIGMVERSLILTIS